MKTQRYLNSKSLSILLFLFMFVMYAVVYMTKSMFSSAMASIVEEGFMTKSQTGLINAVFWLVYAAFQIVGGFAADKYSPYKLIMIGLFGSLISNVIIFYNQTYYVMMAAWVFNAIAQFGLWPGVFKVISTQLRPDLRSKGVFWILFATSLGLGMSMLVASFVTNWKYNFLVSIIASVLVIVVYAVLNFFVEREMVTVEIDPCEKKDSVEKAKTLPLMIMSGLIVLLFVCLSRVAIDNGIKMMTPTMLMESYDNLPAYLATRISSILVIFSALGIFVARFVQQKITNNEVKAQIMIYSALLIPLAVAYFVGTISYWWILLALSVVLFLNGGAAPFSQSFLSVRFEKYGRIGTVSGILNAAASVGNILASYLFARMAETMSWQGVVVSWVIVDALCVILCVSVLRRWSRFLTE